MPTPNTNTPALPVYEVDTLGRPIDDASNTSGRAVVGNVNAGATDAGAPVKIGGIFQTTPPTLTNGQRGNAQLGTLGAVKIQLMVPDTNSPMNFTPGNTDTGPVDVNGLLVGSYGRVFNGTSWDRQRGDTTGSFTVGNVASLAADAGNPVKVGAVYSASSPARADGQRSNLETDQRGNLRVTIRTPGGLGEIGAISSTTDAQANQTLLTVGGYNFLFNGTAWDRARGDVTGTWVHAPTNTVSTALSGTIATSGATAAIAFVNTARQEVINPSTGVFWASWGTPAVNGAGSFQIAPGGSFSTDRTTGTLTLLSTAATQPYTVNRYS